MSEEQNFETTMAKVVGDWQIGCNNIKKRMVNLYYSDSWTDCTFLVGTEQLVSAHKVVLAAASPVFAAMFFGGMPENGCPIHIDDIKPDTFIEMLRYIYTDNKDIITFNDACALYYAAKKYMLLHLKTECLEYLIKNVKPEDCCLGYEFAQMFDESGLLNACEELMKTKTKEVLNSAGFLDASLKTVHFIYSLDNLSITSELNLFEALVRYATANETIEKSCQNDVWASEFGNNNEPKTENLSGNNFVSKCQTIENGIIDQSDQKDCVDNDIGIGSDSLQIKNEILPSPKDGDDETKNETVEDSKTDTTTALITIRHILKLIRFLTMSAEEFTRLPAASFLLNQTEILSILINIINNAKSDVPMPKGFSTVKKIRFIKEYLEPGTRGNIIKFYHVVPDCKHLQNGDVIHFPQFYARKNAQTGSYYSWRLELKLVDKLCKAYIYGSGPEVYTSCWKLCVISKQRESDWFTFRNSISFAYRDEPYLGSLGPWSNLLDEYLEDGALGFSVEINTDP